MPHRAIQLVKLSAQMKTEYMLSSFSDAVKEVSTLSDKIRSKKILIGWEKQ